MLEAIRLKKEYMKAYIALVIASLVYIVPVLWAGRYYNDDLARTLYGLKGWKGDGRPLGEWLIVAMTGFGEYIDDIAPLSWLIAVVILSYGLIVYAQNCLDDVCGSKWCVIPLLFVVTNPFAIENWSYRYDCIIMFTAMAIVFLLYSLPKQSYIRYAVITLVATILIMSTYQVAIGMCIVLSALDVFLCVKRQENIRRALVYNLIAMLTIGAGAVLYKFTIAEYFVDEMGWQKEASQLLHGSLKEILVTVYNNVMGALRVIGMFWTDMSWVYKGTGVLIILFAFVLLLYSCYYHRENRIMCLGLGSLFLPVAFGGTFLPLVLLNSSSWTSRRLLSFGGFFFFVAVVLFAGTRSEKRRKICVLLLSVCLFQHYTYMAAYGNALKSQKEYDEYLVYWVMHDVETVRENEECSLSFVGNAPRPREVVRLCEKYRHFYGLILTYFTNDTWQGGAYVYRYAQDDVMIENIAEEEQNKIITMEPCVKNSVYSCYKIDNKIIVKFEAE